MPPEIATPPGVAGSRKRSTRLAVLVGSDVLSRSSSGTKPCAKIWISPANKPRPEPLSASALPALPRTVSAAINFGLAGSVMSTVTTPPLPNASPAATVAIPSPTTRPLPPPGNASVPRSTGTGPARPMLRNVLALSIV